MEKTNRHVIKLLQSLFILLYASILPAQYCGLLTPDNHEEVIRDIYGCFSENVDLEENQIAEFLAGGGDNWYSAELQYPEPDDIVYGERITFNWAPVSRATYYQTRTLNLNTGATSQEWKTRTGYTAPQRDDKLYLFLFSTLIQGEAGVNSITKSADYIIIDENPIIREPNLKFACACESGTDSGGGVLLRENKPARIGNIYPNPMNGEARLEYHLESEQEVSIILTDAFGKIQKELQAPIWKIAGLHQLDIQLNDLPDGLYHCLVTTKRERQHYSFLKIKK